ncbi:MAG TPA: 3-hydroxylacyl-ACP dehydratase [Usitatibacter sp.]|nr:3-hydroxylacyl-ACP dehydratase [Usitatibacter sp.]
MSTARDRAWIASHLPHRDGMCLLDEIVDWDVERLLARATSHRRADHPLRRQGLLPIAIAVEYGAQAVAAHGALLADDSRAPAAGYLASVRNVVFHAERLDDIEGALEIRVEAQGRGTGGMVYGFSVSGAGRVLAAGRVAIVLGARATA